MNNNSHIEFNNQMWGHFGFNVSSFAATYSDREARGGPAIRRSADSDVWGGVEGDRRKKVIPRMFGGYFSGDDGHSHGWWVDPNIDFRASSRFSASLGVDYRKSVNDNQWRGNFGETGADSTHYTFARLHQTTIGVSSRINFTATPNLSLQVYAQPFISTGDYSNWRELDDPRAEAYDGRYKAFSPGSDPGGFNFKQFQSNTVVRWEYRPGSTLFFVWSQGRDQFQSKASRFSANRDYGDLFEQHPNNTFLIKASYWFSL